MPPCCALPLLRFNTKEHNVMNLTMHGLLGNSHACDVTMFVGAKCGVRELSVA